MDIYALGRLASSISASTNSSISASTAVHAENSTQVPAVAPAGLADKLQKLITDTGGRPSTTTGDELRGINRSNGVAEKVADFVALLMLEINNRRKVKGYREEFKLDHVFKKMKYVSEKTEEEKNVMKFGENAIEFVKSRGTAFTNHAIGVCGEGIPSRWLTDILEVSKSTINTAKQSVQETSMIGGPLSLFSTLQKTPGASKKRISDLERAATVAFMLAENPSRSGDVKDIAWMVLDKMAFYIEVYRSHYSKVLAQAFKMAPNEVRELAQNPKSQWDRNLALYLKNGVVPTKKFFCESSAVSGTKLQDVHFKAANAEGEAQDEPLKF